MILLGGENKKNNGSSVAPAKKKIKKVKFVVKWNQQITKLGLE
jgi:hypothetical protein